MQHPVVYLYLYRTSDTTQCSIVADEKESNGQKKITTKKTSQLSVMSRRKNDENNEELKEGSFSGSAVVLCTNNKNGPVKSSTKLPVPTKRKISKGISFTKHQQCYTLNLNL